MQAVKDSIKEVVEAYPHAREAVQECAEKIKQTTRNKALA